jgi:hypothetical protein
MPLKPAGFPPRCVPDNHSYIPYGAVERVRRAAYRSAAMAFAASTSGPGRGTKIVRR